MVPRVDVEVTLNDDDDDDVVKARLAQVLSDALQQRGPQARRGAVITVRVEPLAGDAVGYGCRYQSLVDGTPMRQRVDQCRLCTEDELVAMATQGVLALAEDLASLAPVSTPPPTVMPVATLPKQRRPEQQAAPLGGLGVAGIVVASAGTAVLATGVGLLARKDTTLASDPTHVKSTQVPGAVLAATGCAALIAGVVMLVVERTRAKQAHPRRITWKGGTLGF